MNISKALSDNHSKQQITLLTEFVGSSPARMSKVIKLYFDNDKVLAPRAAWLMSTVALLHPELIYSHLEKLLKHIQKPGLHDAIKRNAVRILQHIEIPGELTGLAADVCFKFMSDPAESIAVRCFSMTVLSNICKKEPELINELRLVIEASMPYATAGFRSRVKRTFRELKM